MILSKGDLRKIRNFIHKLIGKTLIISFTITILYNWMLSFGFTVKSLLALFLMRELLVTLFNAQIYYLARKFGIKK